MKQKSSISDSSSLIHSFCEEQRNLLRAELQVTGGPSGIESKTSQAQKQKEGDRLKSEVHVLHNLHNKEVSVGLYGRTVVQLGRAEIGRLLPAHRFTTGDQVEIRASSSTSTVGGVISQVTPTAVSVALFGQGKSRQKKNKKESTNKGQSETDEGELLTGKPPYSLLSASSVEVHRKLVQALDELERYGGDHAIAGPVIRDLFGSAVNSQEISSTTGRRGDGTRKEWAPIVSSLDASQCEAIDFSLTHPSPVALIHGPPGTGKTTTVVALIRRAVASGMRVLVTAPSNVAVDNVLSRLVTMPKTQSSKLRVVRLGHPARLHRDILPYSLEALVQVADGTEVVADVRRELASFLKSRHKKGSDEYSVRREIRSLRQEIRQREEKVVQELMKTSQVVLATCVGAASRLLTDQKFDLVVIDEAAQALEAACWIPILKGTRLVLAGDHHQLPPTIKNHQVEKELGRTLFERIMQMYSQNTSAVARMLKVQYRMNETIANWASAALYDGKLSSADSVRHRTLSSLPVFHKLEADEDDVLSDTPLLLLDTAGCAMHEGTNSSGSRFNSGEADLVVQHVLKLLDRGLQQNQIAVVTPYSGQVEVLRSMLLSDYPRLEVRTVDGFQGGEREAVVLSLVRSSARRGASIGFLRDDRRLNVAVTRAMRHCCVICDSETVSQSPFVRNLITWIEDNGEVRTAMEALEVNTSSLSGDRLHAQAEIERMMALSHANSSKPEKGFVKSSFANAKIDEENRDKLLKRIREFVESSKLGDSLELSADLSSRDRKAVHEYAEQVGIVHESSGEGVDRYMVLSIPHESPDDSPTIHSSIPVALPARQSDSRQSESRSSFEGEEKDTGPNRGFAALCVDDDEEEEEEDERKIKGGESDKADPADVSSINPTLADLARERKEREIQRRKHQVSTPKKVTSKATNKHMKTGKKLGGKKKPVKKVEDNLEAYDGMDDLAFLDAQIEKVQTSHGRKVTGKGSYRTIVNGILIAKPEAPERRDTKASNALKSKLRQAQHNRKAKSKNKR